ncbi:MAG: hypothetical protein HY052_04055 [Proteobacteria bacterium]|nr:hypothetical protein [Pseudomonadota bacterium]
MENRIPLPTDSLYKFCALFGILLFVFGFGTSIYITYSTNELLFKSDIEYESIRLLKDPTPVDIAKQRGIEKRVEVALSDKKFFLYSLGTIIAGALFLMIYGFSKWYRVTQPIQDETARLELEKLRKEVNGSIRRFSARSHKREL